MHQDLQDNFLLMLSGTKRVRLWPPHFEPEPGAGVRMLPWAVTPFLRSAGLREAAETTAAAADVRLHHIPESCNGGDGGGGGGGGDGQDSSSYSGEGDGDASGDGDGDEFASGDGEGRTHRFRR